MNVFFLDLDPRKASRWMVDKHVVKMVTEYAQLLGTTHRVLNGQLRLWSDGKMRTALPPETDGIKLGDAINLDRQVAPFETHKNHPCAKWLQESPANYYWVFQAYLAAGDEYARRYGRLHLAITNWSTYLERKPPYLRPLSLDLTPPALAMPDEFKAADDVQALDDFEFAVTAYRRYYRQGKAHLHAWKRPDSRPSWID